MHMETLNSSKNGMFLVDTGNVVVSTIPDCSENSGWTIPFVFGFARIILHLQ